MNFPPNIKTNKENEAIEEIIDTKLNEIATLKSSIINQEEHISSVLIHLQYLFDQLNELQNLNQAKYQEIQSETNWQKLVKAEVSRSRQENERLQKISTSLKEKKQNQLSTLSNLKIKVEQLKAEFQVNRNHMYTWVNESIIKELNDNKLRNYIQEDSSKIKKLRLQVDSLTAEELKKRQLVDTAVITLKANQSDLEKITNSFKTTHQECQKNIHQWEKTVQQIHIRDEEIENQVLQLLQTKENVYTIQNEIVETEEKVKACQSTRDELFNKVSKAKQEVSRLKIDLLELEKKRDESRNIAEVLKSSNTDHHKQITKFQQEIENINKKIKNETIRFNKITSEREILHDELYNKMNTNKSAAEQQRKLEMWLMQEKKFYDSIVNECDIKSKEAANKKQEFAKVKEENKLKKKELEKIKAIKNESKNTAKNLEDNLKKQFQLMQIKNKETESLRMKLSSMKGHDSDETDQKKKIQLLKETVAAKEISCQTLNQETQQQQNYITWQDKELKKCQCENKNLSGKLEDIALEYEVMQKDLQEQTKIKQQLTVKEMLLKLEVQRLNESNEKVSNSVDDINKRRKQAEQMIMKRQFSIKIEQEAAEKEIRLEESNKKRLTSQLTEIITKTTNLKKRYEIELMPLKSFDTIDIEPINFLLKINEEKEDLKLKNLKYQEKLQKGQLELLSYQNTINALNDKNEALWKSIYSSPENNALAENISKLETYLIKNLENLDQQRKKSNKLEEDIQKRQSYLNQLNEEARHLELINEEKEQQLKELCTAVTSQQIKQNRAIQLIDKIKKKLPDKQCDIEVKLKVSQIYNKNLTKALSNLINENSEILPAIESHLTKFDFVLPQINKSRSSSPARLNGSKNRRQRDSLPSTSDSHHSDSSRSTASVPSIVKIEFESSTHSQAKGITPGETGTKRKEKSSKSRIGLIKN